MSEPMKIECTVDPMKVQIPIAKTFIQYPVLRNPSLEAFVQERETTSCPASRMASIDEEDEAPCTPTANLNNIHAIAKEIDYTVKNTFIDGCDWDSLRRPSLEGFYHERQLKSCPASRTQSLDDAYSPMKKQVPSFDAVHFPMKINEEEVQDGDAQEFQISGIRSRSISLEEWSWDVERPALRSHSLEECLRDIEAKYQDLEPFDDISESTKTRTPEYTASVTPEDISDHEEDIKAEDAKPCAISLTNGLGLWSAGSAQHFTGNCKPCAFLWKDENGCQNGAECVFCHMCPPGEKKKRKKEKLQMRKTYRIARQAHQQYQQPQAFPEVGQSQAFQVVAQPQAFQGVAYYRMC